MDDISGRYPVPADRLKTALSKLIADGYLILHETQNVFYHSIIYDRALRLSMNLTADEIKTREAGDLASLLAHLGVCLESHVRIFPLLNILRLIFFGWE